MASAKSKKKSKKKGGSVTINMEGVESGGRSMSDGWASGRIKSAELGMSSNDNEMFTVIFEATRGKEKANIFDHLVMTPNALWKVKSLLEAAGVEVPDDEMTISEDDLTDLEMDIEITNEDYEGQDRPKITGFAPAGTHTGEEDEEDDDEDEEDEEDEEEEEEAPKSKKKAKGKKAKAEEEDDEEDEDDDDSDDDEDDDSDDEDEEEEDDEEEDDDDEEDEEEEDDEPPKKKGKKKAPKLRAGMKVSFQDDKGKTKKGVITSIDDDVVFVEDAKGVDWELAADEIEAA